mmetsp:Transcript_37912/g.80276  ORF Transcript_37912/g.80276 Transcript_37912/m.80276 type:complete len:338 (+) Transcript_37912:221-1234(+)
MYTEPVMRNYPQHAGSFASDGSSAYLHAAGSSNDAGTAYTTAMTHVIKAPQPAMYAAPSIAQPQPATMCAAPSSPQLGMFAAPSAAVAAAAAQAQPATLFTVGPPPPHLFPAPPSPQGGMFAAPSSPTPSPFVFVPGVSCRQGPAVPPPPPPEMPSSSGFNGSGSRHLSASDQQRLQDMVQGMLNEQQEMRYELNRMNYHCDDQYNKIDTLRNDLQAKYDEMDGGTPYSNRSMEQTRDAVFAIPPPSETAQDFEPGGHFSNPLDAAPPPTAASIMPGQPRKPAKPPRNLDFEGSTEILNSFKGLLANPSNQGGGDTTSSKNSRVRSHSKRKRFCGCF